MVTIKYGDLEEALEFVSSGELVEHSAYVSLDTGRIYWVCEDQPEDVPDDLETSDRYLEIPHKHDLDLGRSLVFRFVETRWPQRYERVQEMFHHRGAYRRFKELLDGEGRLDGWYAFEADATKQALKEWCEANGLQLTEAAADD